MIKQSTSIAARATRSVSPGAALREVQEFLAGRFAGRFVSIYEAGGGSASALPLNLLDKRNILVVDIDEIQLRNNDYADTKILGDIQTYAPPPNSFDLITCYNVIEHLPAVDQAIKQFYCALAPGGLLFIGAPNPESLFGMITKYSPHWFHVWFYRVILRRKDAGKPGHVPFPTFYHPIVSPKKLLKFSALVGFEVIYLNIYIGDNFTKVRQTRPVIGWLLNVAMSLLNALTFNKLNLAHGDYHVVLRKPAESTNL
jgi:Methylase of chemotaxis methyl-accepting proteins